MLATRPETAGQIRSPCGPPAARPAPSLERFERRQTSRGASRSAAIAPSNRAKPLGRFGPARSAWGAHRRRSAHTAAVPSATAAAACGGRRRSRGHRPGPVAFRPRRRAAPSLFRPALWRPSAPRRARIARSAATAAVSASSVTCSFIARRRSYSTAPSNPASGSGTVNTCN